MTDFGYNAENKSSAPSRSQPSERQRKHAYFTVGQFRSMSTSTCSEEVVLGGLPVKCGSADLITCKMRMVTADFFLRI